MSEPKRYDVGMTTEFNPHGFNHSFPRVYEAEQGKYVEYEDYAILKAEVERLTKAGDSMAELMFIDKDYIGSPKQEAVVEWCKATEAKEGKPRA